MVNRIASLIIALFLAWCVSPYLADVFWFLPIQEIAQSIELRPLFSKEPSFYVGFAIFGLLFFKLLEMGGLAYLLTGPKRFGNTPLVRRAQGLTLTAAMLGFFLMPLVALLGLTPFGREIMLDGMERQDGPKAFLSRATTRETERLAEINGTLNDLATKAAAMKFEGAFAQLKDWWYDDTKYTQKLRREESNLLRERAALLAERGRVQSDVATLTTGYLENNPAAIEKTRAAVWDALATHDERHWKLLGLSLRYLWAYALPVAVLLHLIFSQTLRRQIARLYLPLMRFYDSGQFGLGGSGRFAGMFEEMTLEMNLKN
jgi:hypothetical protein